MKQYTVVITIGSGGCDDYALFKHDVREVLEELGAVIVQRPSHDSTNPGQIGEWEGAWEFASAFVAFVDVRYLHKLRDELDVLRVTHNQEAIGFIVVPGTNHLISGDE